MGRERPTAYISVKKHLLAETKIIRSDGNIDLNAMVFFNKAKKKALATMEVPKMKHPLKPTILYQEYSRLPTHSINYGISYLVSIRCVFSYSSYVGI